MFRVSDLGTRAKTTTYFVQKRPKFQPVQHNQDTYGQMETPEKFQDMSRMCFPSNKFELWAPTQSRVVSYDRIIGHLPIQLCVHSLRSGITTHVILYFDSSERVLHQPHNPVNLPSHDHRRLVTARVSSAPICSHIVRIGVWSVRSES